MTCDLTNPIFTNEEKAIAHMEADRWPNGVICPLCGVDTVTKMGGKTQAGMFMCNGCRGKFTVRTGTIFERSHIPLHKWLLATHLMASSKKGISAHQLHRMLGITYKSAWFMAHRIREAMSPAGKLPPMGGEGKIVEADETYVGRKRGRKAVKGAAGYHMHTVVALVERGGPVRSFHVKSRLTKKEARKILFENVHLASDVVTDDSAIYPAPAANFAQHSTVNHTAGEYVRGDIYTNTIEGVFSIFKRGMIGTYQHCGEQHLQRYLNEFDFRYSNRTAMGIDDDGRATRILKGAEGKRLTYRQVG
ncbi:MAG TPA: IS1595 family transposase [Micropepsaceae bacterium]|nr:IS1595 family transposase [Micropepsaceae bacterium]